MRDDPLAFWTFRLLAGVSISPTKSYSLLAGDQKTDSPGNHLEFFRPFQSGGSVPKVKES